MWRYIDISGNGYHLCIKNKNICIKKDGFSDVFIGISDINSIVIHGKQNTMTEEFLCACMQNNIPIMFCDEKHLPQGMLLSYNQHDKSTERMFLQLKASSPKKKQAWKQIIELKILAQAKVLGLLRIPEHKVLLEKAKRVKSGDSTNEEAQAARIYFEQLFGSGFVRYDDDDEINKLLNYGYTVVRSMVARAVCSHGLHPGMSIFHSNKINNFALIDDLMEPLRPFVDLLVAKMIVNREAVLNSQSKKKIITLITQKCLFNQKTYELKDGVDLYILDYLHFIEGKLDAINVPVFCREEEEFWQ